MKSFPYNNNSGYFLKYTDSRIWKYFFFYLRILILILKFKFVVLNIS